MKNGLPFLLPVLFLLACGTPLPPVQELQIRTASAVKHPGMVVSAHPEASQIGAKVLEMGGNAVDAAVAVSYALAVCLPIAGNIGGGGFAVLRLADGSIASLDFREKAPKKASETMYQDANGEIIPKLSTHGALAVGVPGSVDGMFELHEKHGKLKFGEIIQLSIDLARNGFPITQAQAREFNLQEPQFRLFNPSDKTFLRDTLWEEGDRLVQEELALSLERIRDKGRAGFYEGPTADMMVETMRENGGIITHDDLASYRSAWRKPVEGEYKGIKIISMPPPSSGGICLIQMLNMVEHQPLAAWGAHSVAAIHCMAEAERRVYADRAVHLGDPDFHEVPQEELLDKRYCFDQMSSFDPSKATVSNQVTSGIRLESEQTTHYSIVDKWGNAVSVTTTLNSAFGSKLLVEGAGFFLNNEMDDFSAKPGQPNDYGLVGGTANAIAPNKRMLSSMTPTILEKDGQVLMVVGSPGGSTIITSVFQTIINVLEFGMTMQEAVRFPRFHHQWLPDAIFIEQGGFDSLITVRLSGMGHQFNTRESIGRVDAILVRPDGSLEGGADPRGDDVAIVPDYQ